MMLSMGQESAVLPVAQAPEPIALATAAISDQEFTPAPATLAATEIAVPANCAQADRTEEPAVETSAIEIPPQQGPESIRSAFESSVLFPDSAPSATISNVSKRPRNLRIGPLPSSAAASVSKALGSFLGAETAADLVAPRASVLPKTAGVASAMMAEAASASAFGTVAPRLPARPAGPDARKTSTAETSFEPPIVPAGSRTMPLRRFLRDHDSSNLLDSRSMTAAAPDTVPATLIFGLETVATIAPIAAANESPPPVEDRNQADNESATSSPISPWFAAGKAEIPDVDSEAVVENSWLESDPTSVAPPPADDVVNQSEAGQNLLKIESTVAEFEQWLESVGPNLESVEHGQADDSVEEAGGPEPVDTSIDTFASNGFGDRSLNETDQDFAAANEATLPPNEIEALEEIVNRPDAGTESAAAGRHDSEPGISAEATLATLATKMFEREPADNRLDSKPRSGFDPKVDTPNRADSNEWPSAQDILRWSADRHGRSFLLASTEDLKSLKMAPDRTRPREWFRMNFPTALLLCLIWLGGAGFLVALGMRMSLQDELTQQSIAAVLAAEKTGAVPRLDPASMQRLTQSGSWWEVPPVQRWFRAVFVKMREDKGQPLPVPADQMAAEVASLDPLYPPSRFWKNTSPSADVGEPDLSSLSRDLLPLVWQADIERRRGNHDKANEADRVALKLASDLDKPLRDQGIAYDAEFGTKRFLLPGQKRTLAILKRIAKEPDAAKIIDTVMPKDSPVVWLTAAQLMRHAGFGDPEALAIRAAQFPIPENVSTDRRLALELVRAEANAMLGKNDIAIETYDRLVREIPDSEWKRTVYLNLGMLNLQSLKTEAAKMALKKARGEDPDHEIDRHAIATIRGLSDTRPDGVRAATTVRAN